PQEPGDEPAPDLYAFRIARGLSYHPRNVVYSLYGRLPLEHPIFTTPGLDAVVLTTPAGAALLRGHARSSASPALIVEPLLEREGLVRAHRRLFALPRRLGDLGVSLAGFLDELGGQPDLPTPA